MHLSRCVLLSVSEHIKSTPSHGIKKFDKFVGIEGKVLLTRTVILFLDIRKRKVYDKFWRTGMYYKIIFRARLIESNFCEENIYDNTHLYILCIIVHAFIFHSFVIS